MRARSRNQRHRNHGLHWLLVCLLLLGQTLALAHDHDAGVDTDSHCALCLFAHHTDGSLPGHACGGLNPVYAVLHPPVIHAPVSIETCTQYHSRAPPVILP